MAIGTINLNGVSDKALIKILEIKTKHEKSIVFNPQQPQIVMQPNGAGRPQIPVVPQQYNNANLAWNDADGLAGVIEILKHIHEERSKSA